MDGLLFIYQIKQFVRGISLPVMVKYTYSKDKFSEKVDLLPRLVTMRYEDELSEIK